MEHLKSCPFCGCKEIELIYCEYYFIVRCPSCHISFLKPTAEQAVEVWNKRDEKHDDFVPKYQYNVINKRLKHLLKSKFIASFDKVKPFSCGEEYVRNIEEADAFIEVLKSYVSMDSDLLRKYADVFSDFIERTK